MSKDKGRIGGQFVPLLISTMNSPAWRQLSHSAQMLYVALKRRVPRERNEAFLSFRHAKDELRARPQKIADCFRELAHYGFIVKTQEHCLGVEGKGQSPHWRLTELGRTPRASSDGLPDAPTRDFLKWDGVVFERPKRKRSPGPYGCETESQYGRRTAPVRTGVTPLVRTGVTPRIESGTDGVHIENAKGGTDGVHITSITTGGCPEVLPSPLQFPSKPSLVQPDPRLQKAWWELDDP